MTSPILRRIVANLVPAIFVCMGFTAAMLQLGPNLYFSLGLLAVIASHHATSRHASLYTAAGVSVLATYPILTGASDIGLTIGFMALWEFPVVWISAGFVWSLQRRQTIAVDEISRVFDVANKSTIVTDLKGQILTASHSAASYFNLELEDLVGENLETLLGPGLWQAFVRERVAVNHGQQIKVDFEVESTAGQPRTISCHVTMTRDPADNPAHFVIQIDDLTDTYANQRAMANAGRQLRRVLGKSSDLVVLTDAKLCINFVNENAQTTLGTEFGNLLGRPLFHVINAADRRVFMKCMEQFAQKNRNEAGIEELRLADLDDTPAAVHITRLSAPLSAQENTGYAVVFSIVEGHMRALAEAKISQARFSQVFHGTPDAILLLRASDSMVLDFNEGFTRLLGYTRENAIGEIEQQLSLWANPTERAAILERVQNEREVIDHETTLRTHSGTTVHVEISLRYVEIDGDLCMLCIGRDITKRISAEAALVESEEKFEKVFSESPDGIVILRHSDGVITDLNNAILQSSGYTHDEIVGQSIYEMQSFIDGEDLQKANEDLTNNGRLANRSVTFLSKSGQNIPALISATVFDLSGEPHVMVIAKDVSNQRSTEERLRSSEERFRGIFETSPIGILLVDMQGRIFQANRTAADLLAYDDQHMYGIHISRLVPTEERQNLKTSLFSLTVKDKKIDRAERRMICQNGLEIWTNFHIVLQQNSKGDALYYIVQIADISDVKTSQERMERMAFYDTLTDLANRRLFHERLQHAIDHSARTKKSSALLYLDLDNFKRVNDTLGHEVGDHLLQEVATRLKDCVRSEDTVGRAGGDEFNILLSEIGSPSDAGMVAQKILNHLREPIHISGHPLIMTTSIGITVIPGDATEPTELMRNADLAMYKAKERGRNNYQFYSNDLNTNAAKRLRTEYEIRQALERKEFELFYQPKVALSNRQIVGVESLIRWNHPERGLLTPDEFIEVAEDTGSIIDIGAWVIEEACRACQKILTENGRAIQIAINISPRQFRDPNLVATLRRSLREASLDPQNIELEITETMLMQDVEAARITLQRLSDLGVSLAIDDFGTGYSSLNYLKRFPIDTVKVDRSFIMDLPTNADDMAITGAVIAMAHQLKMEVVAEGVETAEQLAFLAEQNCEYAQGWLFSKALPLPGVIELLSNNLGIIRVA